MSAKARDPNRLAEVVRVFDSDGRVPVERAVLFTNLEVGSEFTTADPPAKIEVGFATLREYAGTLHCDFQTELGNAPSDTPGLRMQGFAFRIKLRENQIDQQESLLSSCRPMFFEAFRALGCLLEAYRLAMFQTEPAFLGQSPGPWNWLDPARPDGFSQFLSSSYAVFLINGRSVVEASLQPKMYSSDLEQRAVLKETIAANMVRPQPLERRLMLDAWIALDEGNVRSAVVLANTALEVAVKGALIAKLTDLRGGDAQKRIEGLLRYADFHTSHEILLPLAGLRLALDKEVRRNCHSLREGRTNIVHRGKGGPAWEPTRGLLESAEAFLQELRQVQPLQP